MLVGVTLTTPTCAGGGVNAFGCGRSQATDTAADTTRLTVRRRFGDASIQAGRRRKANGAGTLKSIGGATPPRLRSSQPVQLLPPRTRPGLPTRAIATRGSR